MGHVNIWNLTGPGGEWGARVVLCPNDVHGNVLDETVHLLSNKVQQLPIHPSEQHIDSNSQNSHKTPECVNCVCGGGMYVQVYTPRRVHTPTWWTDAGGGSWVPPPSVSIQILGHSILLTWTRLAAAGSQGSPASALHSLEDAC